MKTLKAKRTRRIALMAIAIIAIIAGICISVDPAIGGTATLAMATVVGTVTLEGKEEAMYLALKESIASEAEKFGKGYIKEDVLIQRINEKLEKFAPNIKDHEDFKTLESKLLEALDTVKAQGLVLKGLQETTVKGGKGFAENVKNAIVAHREANKSMWESFAKNLPNAQSFEIEIPMEAKAAATMLESTHAGALTYFPAVEVMPGFVDMARQRPSLLTHMNYSSTTSRMIVWVEKYSPEGNASWTAEGGVKPLVSFKFKTNTSTLKKVADKIKVSTEMLDDVDFLSGEIANELRYLVDMAVDTSILSGAGGDDLTGIIASASAYVPGSLKTTTPNNYDAIKAAAVQITNLYHTPTKAFVHPSDMAAMELTKTTDGAYVIPPFATANGRRIAGLEVIESPAIPEGYLLIGDTNKCKIREKGSFGATVGYVNDDFEKNLVTIIGERRMHLFIADNDSSAFVYDTLANIKTAITAL